MLKITGDADGLPSAFAELIEREKRQEENATAQKNKRWHAGRVSAFREALELTDAALRSGKEQCAVELRSASDIITEINEGKGD